MFQESTTEDFQVCITIYEARYLAWSNINPTVCIEVGDLKKWTRARESTDCPYFNEYFVFELDLPFEEFLDQLICISVYHVGGIFEPNRLLGGMCVDIGTIWLQKGHSASRKWVPLIDPEDFCGPPNGFVKCDIKISARGERIEIPVVEENEEYDFDDIEGNLIIPESALSGRQRAVYQFSIYKMDLVRQAYATLLESALKKFGKQYFTGVYIKITFGDLKGTTNINIDVNEDGNEMTWNESLKFLDVFPPFAQRFKIQICYSGGVWASFTIELNHISKNEAEGFLPTFGPAFTYLYGPINNKPISAKRGQQSPHVDYRGKLLWALETQLEDTDLNKIETTRTVIRETALSLQDEYWNNVSILLMDVIFGGTLRNENLHKKQMTVELCMGPITGKNASQSMIHSASESDFPSSRSKWRISTAPFYGKTESSKKSCRIIRANFQGYCPCLYIQHKWPVVFQRLWNRNMLLWIANTMKWEIWKMQEMSVYSVHRLQEIFQKFIQMCEKYVLRVDYWQERDGKVLTKLDKEHIRFCASQMDYFAKMASSWCDSLTRESVRTGYHQLRMYVRRLEYLTENPQDTLPDIIIWLRKKGIRYALTRISTRRLLYSDIQGERGDLCGRVVTFCLQVPGRTSQDKNCCASFEMLLWLSSKASHSQWINMLPPGRDEISVEEEKNFTEASEEIKAIKYERHLFFEVRAYLYQARIFGGADVTGLCDPFLRISIRDTCKISQTKYATLNPLWNQTLILENVALPGDSEEYYQKNPPYLFIELLDEDKSNQHEYMGCLLTKVAMLPSTLQPEKSVRKNVKILREVDSEDSSFRFNEYDRALEQIDAPNIETYDAINEIQLRWLPVFRSPSEHIADINAAFEMRRIPEPKVRKRGFKAAIPIPLPSFLSPALCVYRFEVMFWGIRDLRPTFLTSLRSPIVVLECSGYELRSSHLPYTQTNFNYPFPLQKIDMVLPMNAEHRPALTIKVIDTKRFGRMHLVGCHVIRDMDRFLLSIRERSIPRKSGLILEFIPEVDQTDGRRRFSSVVLPGGETNQSTKQKWTNLYNVFMDRREWDKNLVLSARIQRTDNQEGSYEDDTESDWWTKYYNGIKLQRVWTKYVENLESGEDFNKRTESAVIMIYSSELEEQPEFHYFMDWLHTFPIYHGKWRQSDVLNDNAVAGKFKGSFIIYKLPEMLAETDVGKHFTFSYPSNDSQKIIVRVYVIKAIGLHPMDTSGKSDPYVVVQIGKKKITDVNNYVPSEINPVFGRCYEMEAILPQEYILKIRIMDYDISSRDDLIGETTIDLENRYYSFHRGTCGIASRYDEYGYNAWRDGQKPSDILKDMCKKYQIFGPRYEENRVIVDSCVFSVSLGNQVEEEHLHEILSLKVLHHWQYIPVVGRHLVPEHVETRSLFNPDEPGIERGKVQLWVDLLQPSDNLPPPVDITPRKPRTYELRCIVWNVEDIILTEYDIFTGDTVSDIYIKGWLTSPEESQKTDVHYRSLNGEGMFNWRFVFKFEFVSAERKIVITKKRSFSREIVQELIPCQLSLQAWDNDRFSADDYLGMLTLDLLRLPRGAKESSQCSLRLLDAKAPTVNLFKVKCTRGWWPFQDIVANASILVGKVELELEILTDEESALKPAGKGRSDPEKLPEPKRPDTSFSFFRNPIRALIHLTWHRQKWRYLKLLILVLIFIFLGHGIYSIPGYSVKKILGA